MTDYAYSEYCETAQLLDGFGCRSDLRGYFDFVELVYSIRLKWRENGRETAVISPIVLEMCKVRHVRRSWFYSGIRLAIAPLLSADDDFWRSFCGTVPTKLTVGGVAYLVAHTLENQPS